MLGSMGHIALTVSNPGRTASFLRDLFDVPVLQRTDAEGHDETFAKLGGTGTSHYFFDFDNHVFELDSSDLEQGLNARVASLVQAQ